MSVKDILIEFGAHPIPTLTGAIGTLIAVVMNKNEFSFKVAVAQVLSGVSFAGLGANLLASWFGLDNNPALIGVFGLFLGICGINIVKGALYVGKQFEKDPMAFIKKKNDTNS